MLLVLFLAFQSGLPFAIKNDIKNSAVDRQFSLPNVNVCKTPLCQRAARFYRLAMDITADPCDDFYQYACGLWQQLNVIPEGKGYWSTYAELADSINIELKNMLNTFDPAKYSEKSIKLLQDVYKKCVNEDAIELAGAEPLREHIRSFFFSELNEYGHTLISRLSDLVGDNLEMLAAHLWLNNGVSVLVTPYVEADMKNNTYNTLNIDQATLGLGYESEDYYTGNSDNYQRVLEEYQKLMEGVSAYLWNADPNEPPSEAQKRDAAKILDFEIELARLNKPANERRDPAIMYNKMTPHETSELGKKFNLLEYLSHLNCNGDVNIVEPQYIRDLNRLIDSTPPDVVRGYFLWRLILSRLPFLARSLSDKYYNFTKAYVDAGRNPNREQYCVKYVMGGIDEDANALGYALGRLFIDMKNFTSDTKQQMNEMINELYKSFNMLLEENDWMDDETKEKARLKIQQMVSNVGYPDIIVDDLDSIYTPLLTDAFLFFDTKITDADSFYDINNKLKTWTAQKQNLKVGTKADRYDFGGSPAIVNAWFHPSKNSITFPAGILQPPFYHQDLPMYINFGSMGCIIGHEITHAFDDTGSQYDGVGNLKDWWTELSRQRFEEKAQCMIDQYSSFCYPSLGENMCVNGVTTQGENIADNGGLIQGFYAYKNYMNGKNDSILPSFEEFTPEQLFFIAYASFECSLIRDAALANQISTNPHPPGRVRIIVPFQNFPEFSRAFNCPIGSPMNPAHKCRVW